MRLLATAKPNMRYRNHASVSDIVLQVRLVGSRVIYYETHSNDVEWTVSIPEKTVRALFPKGKSIKDQPFLSKENKDFYTVLFRNRKRYKEAYQLLLKKHTTELEPERVRFRRTKRIKIKRRT